MPPLAPYKPTQLDIKKGLKKIKEPASFANPKVLTKEQAYTPVGLQPLQPLVKSVPQAPIQQPVAPQPVQIDQYQKDTLMQLGGNIAQGDDMQTIKSKFPEIQNLDDEVLRSLGANIAQGDDMDTIITKYPELQQLKIANRAGKDVFGPATQYKGVGGPIVRGLGQFGMNVMGAEEKIVEGAGGITEKIASDILKPVFFKPENAPQRQKLYNTPLSSDVFKLVDGVSTALVGAYAPVLGAGLPVAGQTKLGKPVVDTLGGAMNFLGENAVKLPGLSQYSDSLQTEQEKEEFKQFLGGTVLAYLTGAKNKKNIYKDPVKFIKENINPTEVIAQAQENILNIPRNVVTSTKGLGQTLSEVADKKSQGRVESQWKMTSPNKKKFVGITGKGHVERALENDLLGKDLTETAENVKQFQYDNSNQKINEVKTRGKTKTPDPVKLMAKKVADNIEKGILEETLTDVKTFDELTSQDLAMIPPEQLRIYQQARKLQQADDIDYIQIEAIKQLYDHYNPDGLKYGVDGKPVPVAGNEKKAYNRSQVQKFLEDEGAKRGVDIKKMNNNIRASVSFEKGAETALNRMENLNPFGLQDTQMAMIASILADGGLSNVVLPVGGLVFSKSMKSQGIASSFARTFYNKQPDVATAPTISNTAPIGRAGRLGNLLDSPDSNIPTGVKALPAPKATVVAPGGLPQVKQPIAPTPKPIQVLETGKANIKQPSTTKPQTLPPSTKDPLVQSTKETPKLPVAKKTPLKQASKATEELPLSKQEMEGQDAVRGMSDEIDNKLFTEAKKYNSAEEFIKARSKEDGGFGIYRGPIADAWRKEYLEPLKKNIKTQFSTDPIQYESIIDDYYTNYGLADGTKAIKKTLDNKSLKTKLTELYGKDYADNYEKMIDFDLYDYHRKIREEANRK